MSQFDSETSRLLQKIPQPRRSCFTFEVFHPKLQQRNKLKFPTVAQPPEVLDEVNAPGLKRKQPEEAIASAEENTNDSPVAKKKKTRARFRNLKKLALVRAFTELRT